MKINESFCCHLRQINQKYTVMDDIHYTGSEQYNRAEKIEKLSVRKQFMCGLEILFALLPNVMTAFATIGYSVLKQIYYLIYPKPLRNIRGQLAVVRCDNVFEAAIAAVVTLK